jgi:hypothetical protein
VPLEIACCWQRDLNQFVDALFYAMLCSRNDVWKWLDSFVPEVRELAFVKVPCR